MIKSELIQKLSARSTHLYQQDIEKIVNVVLSEITKAMTEGGRVELRGFGTFTTKSRTARIGRNPRTGTAVDVDAKRVPAFRTSRDMKKRLNDPQAALPAQTGADQ